MSLLIPKEQLDKADFGLLIDDAAVFDLSVLQGQLKFTNEKSVKNFCAKHGIRPAIKSRYTWLFTGKMFRQQLEALPQGLDDEAE